MGLFSSLGGSLGPVSTDFRAELAWRREFKLDRICSMALILELIASHSLWKIVTLSDSGSGVAVATVESGSLGTWRVKLGVDRKGDCPDVEVAGGAAAVDTADWGSEVDRENGLGGGRP